MTNLTAFLMAGFMLFAGETHVRVSWDRSPETDVARYTVYVGPAPMGYDRLFDAGNEIFVNIPIEGNFQRGFTYFFAVTATNTAGNESEFSDEIFAVIPKDVQPPPPPPDTLAPAAPRNVLLEFVEL